MPTPKRTSDPAALKAAQKADLRIALAASLNSHASQAQILITLLRVRTLELRGHWLKRLKQGQPVPPQECPFGDADAPVTAAMIQSELPSILDDAETYSIWRDLHAPLDALAEVAERHGIDSTPLRELRGARYERQLDELERLCERLEVCEKLERDGTKSKVRPPSPREGAGAAGESAEAPPRHLTVDWDAEITRIRDSMLARVTAAMGHWGARPKGPLSVADAAELADVYLDAIEMLRVAFDYLQPDKQSDWILAWHAWSLALTGHTERACAQFGVDAVPISVFAQAPKRSTLAGAVAASRALMNKALAAKAPLPDQELQGNDLCVVQALREIGHRVSGPVLMKKAFGKDDSHGKAILAGLVKRKVITNRRDVDPPGYGLPEWL
jgi:hypothetical protein